MNSKQDVRIKDEAQRAEYRKAYQMAEESHHGKCPRCNQWPDFRGLCLAHHPNRRMGGRDVLYLADPTAEYHLVCGCYRCHNVGDHHLREAESKGSV